MSEAPLQPPHIECTPSASRVTTSELRRREVLGPYGAEVPRSSGSGGRCRHTVDAVVSDLVHRPCA